LLFQTEVGLGRSRAESELIQPKSAKYLSLLSAGAKRVTSFSFFVVSKYFARPPDSSSGDFF
jgi:hypothetical protein